MFGAAADVRCDSLNRGRLQLADGWGCHLRGRSRELRRGMVSRGAGIMKVDIGWWLWVFALGFQKTGLQADDIVAQLIIFLLQMLKAFGEIGVVLNLSLELFDVTFFALSKRTLL